MILELDPPEPAPMGRASWLLPAAAGALLALALFLFFGRPQPEAAAGPLLRPAAPSFAVADRPAPRYVPLSGEQLASRAGLEVLSLPPSVGTVSQRTLSSGVTGLVPAGALSPGVQVTFILSDGRIVTLVESTDGAGATSQTAEAERVSVRGAPGVAYTAKSRDQASFVSWTANGVRFELWSRTVETAQLLRLADMLE